VTHAGNLVLPGSAVGEQSHIAIHDRITGLTQQVDVDTGGGGGNGFSTEPVVSPNGRYVAFSSEGTDLVTGDGNGSFDVFVRDRLTGTTERVSRTATGGQATDDSFAPSVSADGRFVTFTSLATNIDQNGAYGVFVLDRSTGRLRRVSLSAAAVPVRGEFDSTMTPDGRYVVFTSPDLVSDRYDRQLYLRDRGVPAA
jgi:Tol biopolymer transport system component